MVLVFLAVKPLHPQSAFDAEFAALWELALRHAPEIRFAQSERRAADARLAQASIPVRSNPEVEIGVVRGHSESGAVFDHEVSGPLIRERRPVSGVDLSFSQEIETGGQGTIRLRIALADTYLYAAREQARAREVRFGLRYSLARIVGLERLRSTLDRQHASLRQIANTYRAEGMRDSRFGAYTLQAIESDLALLDLARSGASSDRTLAEAQLFQLCGQRRPLNPALFRENLETALPPAPPVERLLAAARADNPYLLEAKHAATRSRDAAVLVDRSIYPSVTIFAGVGTERKGTDPAFALPPLTSGPQAEFERRIRFGIRLPVPLFDRGQGRSEESRETAAQSQIQLETAEARLTSRIEVHVARYETGMQSIARLKGQIAQAASVYSRLDGAFLGGRISYGEYWGERSRWMEMERTYLSILEQTAESRMTVEILSGVDFSSVQEKGEPQ